MNQAVYDGFFRTSHKVLGRTLQPYSVAHAFALESGGWDGFGTIAGILGFLRICSSPVGEDCVPRGFPDKLGPTLCDVFRALYLLRNRNKEKVLNACKEYLEDDTTSMELSWPEGPGFKKEEFLGSALIAQVVNGVRSGLPYQMAWKMPVGALNTWVAHYDLTDSNPNKPRPSVVDKEYGEELAKDLQEAQKRLFKKRQK